MAREKSKTKDTLSEKDFITEAAKHLIEKHKSEANCGCKSVGNKGYGAVSTLAPLISLDLT